jgi:hypothetical protein
MTWRQRWLWAGIFCLALAVMVTLPLVWVV